MGLERIGGAFDPRIGTPEAQGAQGGSAARKGAEAQPGGGPSFGDILMESIQEANRLQSSADAAIQDLAAGKTADVAGVMTAVEKADVAFRTLMQVRNKLLDAYDELMRLRI
jgi:flagellar hook-basal body complex protein FliE